MYTYRIKSLWPNIRYREELHVEFIFDKSGTPLYLQIANALRMMFWSGEPGRLPDEPQRTLPISPASPSPPPTRAYAEGVNTAV